MSIPEIINGERDSEEMNEQIKEVALSSSDYAVNDKESLLKKIHTQSSIGVAALAIYFVIVTVGTTMPSWLELLSNYCLTLELITPIMLLLYTTGLLTKTEKRKSQSTMPKSFLILISILVAIIIGLFIIFVLSLSF